MEDGQLDECDLTFKDIDIINQTFMLRVLNGIFHSRIEYPDQVAKEMERGKPRNGSINKRTKQDKVIITPGNGKTPLSNSK